MYPSNMRNPIVRWIGIVMLLILGGMLLHRRRDDVHLAKTRAIVASCFVAHFDVYLPLVKDLQGLLSYSGRRHYPDAVRVHSHPYGFGFEKIIQDLGLYNGFRYTWESLPEAMGTGLLNGISGEGFAEVLVLGTCVFDINEYTKALLPIWDARPADQKFSIVCIGHASDNVDAWKDNFNHWVRRRNVRVLAISEHVAEDYRRVFKSLADSTDPTTFSAGYEYVPVDTYIPLLDLPDPNRGLINRKARGLSHVVIQGSMQSDRRDYEGVLRDLEASLKDDPRPWGYLPLSPSKDAVFEPDSKAALDTSTPDPFVLHLVGRGGIDIPHTLRDVVRIHRDLDYEEFYDLMHTMDLVLPAFSDDSYYALRASSTFAMALQSNVPLLVSNRTRESYVYASDERVVVIRPQGLREIEAIKVLRTGKWTPLPPSSHGVGGYSDPPDNFVEKHLAAGVKRMLDHGWLRTDTGFKAVKKDVWARNKEVVRDILGIEH